DLLREAERNNELDVLVAPRRDDARHGEGTADVDRLPRDEPERDAGQDARLSVDLPARIRLAADQDKARLLDAQLGDREEELVHPAAVFDLADARLLERRLLGADLDIGVVAPQLLGEAVADADQEEHEAARRAGPERDRQQRRRPRLR